jgi:hypothetical protein
VQRTGGETNDPKWVLLASAAKVCNELILLKNTVLRV